MFFTLWLAAISIVAPMVAAYPNQPRDDVNTCNLAVAECYHRAHDDSVDAWTQVTNNSPSTDVLDVMASAIWSECDNLPAVKDTCACARGECAVRDGATPPSLDFVQTLYSDVDSDVSAVDERADVKASLRMLCGANCMRQWYCTKIQVPVTSVSVGLGAICFTCLAKCAFK